MRDALLATEQEGRIRCGLCPNACLIAEGARGVCGARGVVGGRLRALTYGLVSSVAADPIEKKPVFHFRPGTRVLSLGSVGCSMRCGHCQNWQISRPQGRRRRACRCSYVEPQDAVGTGARQDGCAGRRVHLQRAGHLARVRARRRPRSRSEAGLYTVMVTNGYVTPAGLDLFAQFIDVWRVDIKGFRRGDVQAAVPGRAPRGGPASRPSARRTSTACTSSASPTSCPPSTTPRASCARSLAGSRTALGADTPWHVTRFVPYLEFAHLDADAARDARAGARDRAPRRGCDFVYLGNVDYPGGEDTVCPACGAVAVARQGLLGERHRPERSGRVRGVRCGAQRPQDRLRVRVSSRAGRCARSEPMVVERIESEPAETPRLPRPSPRGSSSSSTTRASSAIWTGRGSSGCAPSTTSSSSSCRSSCARSLAEPRVSDRRDRSGPLGARRGAHGAHGARGRARSDVPRVRAQHPSRARAGRVRARRGTRGARGACTRRSSRRTTRAARTSATPRCCCDIAERAGARCGRRGGRVRARAATTSGCTSSAIWRSRWASRRRPARSSATSCSSAAALRGARGSRSSAAWSTPDNIARMRDAESAEKDSEPPPPTRSEAPAAVLGAP